MGLYYSSKTIGDNIMHRFFVDSDQIYDNNIYMEGKDLKHIKSVLRLKVKDRIEVSCDGINYQCEILEIKNDKVIAKMSQIFRLPFIKA